MAVSWPDPFTVVCISSTENLFNITANIKTSYYFTHKQVGDLTKTEAQISTGQRKFKEHLRQMRSNRPQRFCDNCNNTRKKQDSRERVWVELGMKLRKLFVS